ncbi:FAD-dependent oxidoreductase [Eggerthella sp. YY7918]|uniref:oxidoreductase n=1 Tax=Eggerthella sp. (strain YY7918) TaxID=502558 RepID=UPI0002171604|nr:FAD-dependent oxidoreductase [Eggerthella sp. YY7918]BAK44964.1 NADH:flavin oxidoreductase [Eggerthella sp. YY7918]
MSDFQYLFSPLKVGKNELPNRIICAPHNTLYPRGSDQEIFYLRRRAEGGAGTIILASTKAAPSIDRPLPPQNIFTDEGIADTKKTVDALHEAGAKVLVELTVMPGWEGNPQPSHDMPYATGTMRTATTEELDELMDYYVQAIANCEKAGADGVDVYAACGFALHVLFDNRLFGERDDKYGDGVAVISDIVTRARALVSPEFIIALDLNVDEEFLGGITLDEGVEAARAICSTGAVDLLIVDAQQVKNQEGYLHYPSSYVPQALSMYACAAVREAVDIPVVGTHHINTCELAEQLIQEGQCDAVSMCRALIADPEMPNKAKRGENEDIRGCIGDCEACFGRFITGFQVGCSVNPDAGFEYLGDPFAPAETKKKVLVVGGGLSGMEAAYTAAMRGHTVTLMEKDSRLGGYVNVQAALPGLGDRGDIVRWYETQLAKAGVEILLNTEATPETLKSGGFDAHVLATGAIFAKNGISEHYLLPIPGHEADNVLTPEDVLAGKEVGEHVVVYDCTNYLVGPGIAEMLADQGKQVDLITYEAQIAKSLEPCYVNRAASMAVLPKVNYIPDTAVLGIEANTLTVRNRYTLDETEIDSVDTVVLATSRPPQDQLYLAVKDDLAEVYEIGDARCPQMASMQMFAATQAGRAIGKQL